jgi:uncharacterized protein YjbJ (UPF0337 family)
MTQFDKLKLHEICESVKENYLLNTIEESTNEVEILKTKKFLNETTATIERILVEENIVDAIKAQIIEEGIKDYYNQAKDKAQEVYGQAKDKVGQYYNNTAGVVNGATQKFANSVSNMVAPDSDSLAPTDLERKRIALAQWAKMHPGAVAGGAAGLGAAGLGAAGLGAYEAMQDPSMIDQATDMASGMM